MAGPTAPSGRSSCAEAPRHAAPHRRHVHVEEHAVAVQQEPLGARRAGDDQHVRADRLHLLAQPSRAKLHGALEHALHGGDLEPHAHLFGRRRQPPTDATSCADAPARRRPAGHRRKPRITICLSRSNPQRPLYQLGLQALGRHRSSLALLRRAHQVVDYPALPRGFLAGEALDLAEAALDRTRSVRRCVSTSCIACARRSASSRCCRARWLDRALDLFHQALTDRPRRRRAATGADAVRTVAISARSLDSSAASAARTSASLMPRRRGPRRPATAVARLAPPGRAAAVVAAARPARAHDDGAVAVLDLRRWPPAPAPGPRPARVAPTPGTCHHRRGAAAGSRTMRNPSSASGGCQAARSARTARRSVDFLAQAAARRQVRLDLARARDRRPRRRDRRPAAPCRHSDTGSS